MDQMGAFQVEAMSFPIAEHLFNPHPSTVCQPRRMAQGCQQPRFVLAGLPMRPQIDGMGVLGGQQSRAQPKALPRLADQVAEMAPLLVTEL